MVYDKHGELVEVSDPISITVDVEIKGELSPMCRDLLELLNEDDVFSFSLVCVVGKNIDKVYFDLWDVEKIVFGEYFLEIHLGFDSFKVFYNGIFNFYGEKKW